MNSSIPIVRADSVANLNPSFSTLSRKSAAASGPYLSKIVADEVRLMLVVPEWPRAPWFKLFRRLVERQFRVDGPLYLTDDGKLRSAPRWATFIAVVDGASY